MTHSDAWWEGYNDCMGAYRGFRDPDGRNPYDPDTQQGRDWINGWWSAAAEDDV